MIADQWKMIATRITQAWGPSQRWTKAAHLYPDVKHLNYTTMTQVVDDLIAQGSSHAPPPAQLIGLTQQRQGTALEPHDQRPTPDHCNHPRIGVRYTYDLDAASIYTGTVEDATCAICLTDLTHHHRTSVTRDQP